MTAPTPQRAASAEERDRLREALARDVEDPIHGRDARSIALDTADGLIAGPLAPLLDRITAAEARAEEAERERDAAQSRNAVLALQIRDEKLRRAMPPSAQLARADAATADRDRLADEVAALKKESAFLLERLDDFESGSVTQDTARDWHGHVRPSMARLTALTVTGGTTDGQA